MRDRLASPVSLPESLAAPDLRFLLPFAMAASGLSKGSEALQVVVVVLCQEDSASSRVGSREILRLGRDKLHADDVASRVATPLVCVGKEHRRIDSTTST